MGKNILELNTSIEMSNTSKDSVTIKDEVKFRQMVEICSALFAGTDVDKFGKQKDAVVKKLMSLADSAQYGDIKARAEINTIVKFMIEPKLLEAMKVFDFLGNYHELAYHEQPKVKTYNYENIDARLQAANSDVSFAGRNWMEYPVMTRTISAGMAIDYRELASGNFDGSVAEEAAQTADYLENQGVRVYDVGVSGIHRLFSRLDLIQNANCIIAVAGMEGALASVLGGLVDKPVIAVPTSVGYGASMHGISALLTMLNSCANGIASVNIDNGFGAGFIAAQINRAICAGGHTNDKGEKDK